VYISLILLLLYYPNQKKVEKNEKLTLEPSSDILPAFTGILVFSRFSRLLPGIHLRNITGIREYYRFYR
jgi:hypothetical protein